MSCSGLAQLPGYCKASHPTFKLQLDLPQCWLSCSSAHHKLPLDFQCLGLSGMNSALYHVKLPHPGGPFACLCWIVPNLGNLASRFCTEGNLNKTSCAIYRPVNFTGLHWLSPFTSQATDSNRSCQESFMVLNVLSLANPYTLVRNKGK